MTTPESKFVRPIKASFIRLHLIKFVFEQTDKIKKIVGVPANSFIYFDNPIKTTHFQIDRFGKGSFFFKNQVLPIDWKSIDGKILIEAFKEIKQNKVFVLKQIDNRFYKTRVKKDVLK